jgi:dihydrolipoamide dehydrogenase
MVVRTGLEFVEVNESEGIKEVTVKEEKGEKRIYRAETILVAAGQRGNADLLKVEKTGVKADDHGYIKVNKFYETGKPHIWALGDAIGKAMFKHVANRETELVWHSFNHGNNQTIDYDKVPYAIFSYPQVAGVGITEEEATKRGLKYLVGGYAYSDTAYGAAMGEEDGFVKLMVEEETYKILGCHIVGPHAAILIHEVIVAMNAGDGSVYPLIDAMHIHPALNEVVQRAVWQLKKPVYNHT